MGFGDVNDHIESPVPDAPEKHGPFHSLLKRLSAVPTPLIFLVAIGIAMGLLWLRGSLGDVADAIRDADIKLLVAACLLYLVCLAILTLRWHLIIKMIHGASHPWKAAEAFLTSIVINYAAPVSVAVPTRALLTKRALGLSASETGKAVIWEYGSDVLVLAFFSLLAFILTGGKGADGLINAANPALTVGFFALVVVLFVLALIFVRVKKPMLWAKLIAEGRQFIRIPFEHPRDATIVTGVSVIYWGAQVAVFWLMLRGFGVNEGFGFTLGVLSMPILISLFSPAPGGAGVREALMVAIAHIYNADSTAVLVAALTYRMALFAAIPVVYAGVRFVLRREHISPTMTFDELTHPQSQLQGIQPEEPR